MLTEKSSKRAKNDVIRKATELSKYGFVPVIARQKELIEQIIHNDYLERAGITDCENVCISCVN